MRHKIWLAWFFSQNQKSLWGFSFGRFDYTRAYKLVENLFVKENPIQDLLSSMNAAISTNERAWGHVTFKLHYNQIYQMKTTFNQGVNVEIFNDIRELLYLSSTSCWF